MADTHVREQLQEMLGGFWISRLLEVVAELGVADHLVPGPRSIDELAKAVDAHPGALHRVLRALASLGVFTEVTPGEFGLTPMGSFLRTGVPGSLRAYARCDYWFYDIWSQLLYSVRTGKPAFNHIYGKGLFDHLAAEHERAKLFDECMTEYVQMSATAVVAAYDFSQCRTIVDVGGGYGVLLSLILKANPNASGVLIDLPHVAAKAAQDIKSLGLSSRCKVVGGDFFESVPSGGDVYIMSSVIHDWDDERGVRILTNCRRAVRDGGTVLLVEIVLPPANEPSFGKLLDIEVLIMTQGGRERMADEFQALLAAAGLRLSQIVSTGAPHSIIESRPE